MHGRGSKPRVEHNIWNTKKEGEREATWKGYVFVGERKGSGKKRNTEDKQKTSF